jgi:hypothetical protein
MIYADKSKYEVIFEFRVIGSKIKDQEKENLPGQMAIRMTYFFN